MENQYIGGRNCLRKEGLGSLQIYGGRGPDKKEGVVFLSGERGWYLNVHYHLWNVIVEKLHWLNFIGKNSETDLTFTLCLSYWVQADQKPVHSHVKKSRNWTSFRWIWIGFWDKITRQNANKLSKILCLTQILFSRLSREKLILYTLIGST